MQISNIEIGIWNTIAAIDNPCLHKRGNIKMNAHYATFSHIIVHMECRLNGEHMSTLKFPIPSQNQTQTPRFQRMNGPNRIFTALG